MIWSLIVGAVIGAIAGAVTGERRGCLFNIVAGLIGSMIGQKLFSNWGPVIGGMYVVPSILGAVIFVAVVSFFFGRVDHS